MTESEGSLQEEPKILILSGPSGSGKTTIVNELMNRQPVHLVKSISATTRPPREHEVDKADYYFLDRDTFDQKLEQEEFLEHAEVFQTGYIYGTLRTEVDRAARQNAWAFLEIDVEGAMKVMERYPHSLTIFLKTPSEDVYEQRLRNRGTENEETIQRRLATARRELSFADQYRHRVINDDLERALDEITQILVAQE
ncbi:Guanylate kinase [Polystyrenella longa]|uniref:Guanylate kinase n=1 Tax=Polystyrenella longa TaxID=2528007 RepID=A0A518CKX5_9PLAN|nr:Guanylate kinase [Polystyrenella longa]